MTNLTDSTLQGLLWMSWDKAGRAVLQILVVAVLARLIAPSDFGLMGAAFVFIEFAAIFAHIGLGKGLVQHPSLRREHVAVAFHSSLVLAILLGGITWALADAIAAFFRIAALAPVVRVMALTFPLRAVAIASEALMLRDLRFQWLANRDLASYAFGYGCVGLSLAFLGMGVWALVAAHLAQTAASTVLLIAASPVPITVRPEKQAFADLLYFSGGYTLGRVANQLATQSDNLVVGRWLGPTALGIYGRAFQLMAVPADLVGDILDNVLFPTWAAAQNDVRRLAHAFRRGVALVALVTLPASVVCILLAPDIVRITLGPGWDGVVTPFRLLAIGLLFRTSYRMSDALARARGYVYLRAWRQGMYAALVVGGALVGQRWGLAGAASGVLFALCVNFFLMAHLSLYIVGMSWRSFLEAHKPAALLACSSGVVAATTVAILATWAVPPVARVAAAGAATMCADAALAFYFPRQFLGADARWMIDTLQLRFPALQRLHLPAPVNSGVDV